MSQYRWSKNRDMRVTQEDQRHVQRRMIAAEQLDPVIARNLELWRRDQRKRAELNRKIGSAEIRIAVAEIHRAAQSVPMVQIRGLQ